jgi:hypothetical protein
LGMAHQDLGDGYPWDEFDPIAQRPTFSSRLSSVSDLSSHEPSASGSHRDSTVSLPSPTEGGYHPSPSAEDFDVSHARVSSPATSGITSPAARHSRQSMTLPPALRVGTPSGSSSIFKPFRKSSISYEPTTSSAPASRNPSKRYASKKNGSLLRGRHASIPEDEIDMSLLGSAMPMGISKHPNTAYRSLEEDEEGESASMISPQASGPFDISSFTGPMSPRSETQLREYNRQEASGILTGGLGAGWTPDATITSSDLYAPAPSTPLSPVRPSRKVSRKLSFRSPGLARAPTLRLLGQHEANKRGEIIQVIMEESSTAEEEGSSPNVDLSSLQGGDAQSADTEFDVSNGSQNRKGTFTSTKVEMFYPQKNWKPFSMRWPYLSTLIIFSVTLAAAQEYLYRRGPLYEFDSPNELNTWEYFSFKYLPTLIAVTFGVLWQITDFEVKRLEAYYQLSKEGGALAAESINVDYITFFNFLRPVKALRLRHYAVAVSSVATLLAVSAIPTLQSASIVLTPSREEREKDPLGMKKIVINSAYSRCLSVILVIIAFLGCILVYQLQRRRSGLVADVKGIAGIAAMANRSHILMDFKDMDTASPAMIHKQLKTHRYSLRNSSLAPEDKIPLSQKERDKYDAQVKKHENPHPLMLRLVAGIPFIIGMVVFMVLVPIVLFEKSVNAVTDKAPWLMTALAVCIKIAWGTLETDVRMIEPFYVLSKRHASPKNLTLDYTAMPFGWMPIRAFLNGHFLVGLVGLGSVFAEILTVCATSFGTVSGKDFANKHINKSRILHPILLARNDRGNGVDAGEETFASFWVSTSLALAILTFLCFVATLVYARRRHPFLPRQPNTIASILAFIHQSKMLYDFVGTEKMNNDEMVKRLVGIRKTYGLGWFSGRDGMMHCGVDEEELASDYKHGDDARKASMPWTTNWGVY